MVSTTAKHVRGTFVVLLALAVWSADVASTDAQSTAGGRVDHSTAARGGADGKFFFSAKPVYKPTTVVKPYVPEVKKDIVKKKPKVNFECGECNCDCANENNCGTLHCPTITCGRNISCGGCGHCPTGTGDVSCVQPPEFTQNFSIVPIPLTDKLCTTTRNVCCAHGTKCNFGPSIDIDEDTTEVCVPNGIPNQCCVETDDGEGSSTKAIGFIAAKIPKSNGTVGVDVTAPGAGLEQLKNLACYCCEGTLAIQHVEDNTNITVDELKTATCQKKGFTGCNNATGSIKVRAANDPETFAVCALCPFTADAHCKNLTEACVFDVDCCEGLTCMENTCTTPLPPAGRDATALEGDARKSDAAAGRSQAAGRGAAAASGGARAVVDRAGARIDGPSASTAAQARGGAGGGRAAAQSRNGNAAAAADGREL